MPAKLNPNASVQAAVNALTKYIDSDDLVVAIHLDRQILFDPAQLIVPDLSSAELWVFGALEPDQGLWGDFMTSPTGTRYPYPVLF